MQRLTNCKSSVSACCRTTCQSKLPVILGILVVIGLLCMDLVCIFSVKQNEWKKVACAILHFIIFATLVFLMVNLWKKAKIGLEPLSIFWITGILYAVTTTLIITEFKDEYFMAMPFAIYGYAFLMPVGYLYDSYLNRNEMPRNVSPTPSPLGNEPAVGMRRMEEVPIPKRKQYETSSEEMSSSLSSYPTPTQRAIRQL